MNIETTYSLGDYVYFAGYNWKHQKVTCKHCKSILKRNHTKIPDVVPCTITRIHVSAGKQGNFTEYCVKADLKMWKRYNPENSRTEWVSLDCDLFSDPELAKKAAISRLNSDRL
jgi:hypothetical protein